MQKNLYLVGLKMVCCCSLLIIIQKDFTFLNFFFLIRTLRALDTQQTSAPAPVPAESLPSKPLNNDADRTQKTSSPSPAPKPQNDKITTSIADDQAEDDAVDDQLLEDLYGKEHINLVFIGHVG